MILRLGIHGFIESAVILYPTSGLEEVLQVLIALVSVVDPRVDARQQLRHRLLIQDFYVFLDTTWKPSHRSLHQNVCNVRTSKHVFTFGSLTSCYMYIPSHRLNVIHPYE